MRSIILIVLISVVAGAVLSGCIQPDTGVDIKDKTGGNVSELTISQFESTQELKKFSSVKEIKEFLKASSASSGYDQYGGWGGISFGGFMQKGMMEVTGAMDSVMPTAMPAATTSAMQTGAVGAVDYSTTNIQVEGVDEADFVKNDGKHIYVLAQNKLVIVDAFPAAEAETLSTTIIDGRPRDIFVNGDRLIVFTEEDSQVMIFPEYEYMPMSRYTQKTNALVYDISDRKKPVQVSNFSINGNYFQSRMIGDYVYFIVKDSVYYSSGVVDVPVIKRGSVKIMSPDIYYFDNPEQNYVFHTIASVNIKSEKINAKSFMMGYSDNLYVSENNIYITYRRNLPMLYYEAQREERFYKVVVPNLPIGVQDKIIAIKGSDLTSSEKWEKISSILEDTYNNMTENEKQDYAMNVQKAVEEYETKLAQERDITVIQKININKGDIEYRAKGEVPGSLLNQFSMDESGEHFRVATTSQIWTGRESKQYNNVFVMDNELAIAGKLENIAPDERIYSTRFIGNRLYMVTFKRVDPLFVIDLSDPKEPKVLGELKIPGFSDYLHPYDENHIIGVGKETGDNEWGGTSIKGVKLSLFDVSDVNNPKQLDKYEIGTSGTDSEALRDHKAFLFDRKKNLLVIPVREVTEKPRYDNRGYYVQKVWQGAYVFNLTPQDGFKLRGKVSHLDDYEEQMYYWGSPGAVRRSMYMDDVLYTVSAQKIKMNDLNNLSAIKSIDLPYDRNMYYQYSWR
ncbi:MAG: beta-propeller domain-containing protein [Euryarchaeota archaeon]|nr:beta-propeller domain-containing protein [Euryarchaeota archaeon]MBU4454694.1 beta-propeller domain-containing protein [Euryarchaeota archaeon]MCG2736776.1 beta-propeller domain-containing protein [Candidatus Methanoperedenaceae archaeon]